MSDEVVDAGRRSAPPPPGATSWPEHHRRTPFQDDVVDAVAALAPGDLATYDDLAQQLGRPGSAQAVANVIRSAPGLPWWRVVPSDGRLYRTHEPIQRPLLEAEGHRIDADRRVAIAQPVRGGAAPRRGGTRRSPRRRHPSG